MWHNFPSQKFYKGFPPTLSYGEEPLETQQKQEGVWRGKNLDLDLEMEADGMQVLGGGG